MGYFSNIYKCARNDGGWGGWSALSGIDYVAESGKCVVYRVQVNYDAEDTALSALSIATNFVNPLSSDNPSSACCYLYDFDPTFGGSAAIASPPTGCIGTAGPIEFSASHVGSYLTFSFSAPSGTPQTLYFWFTSSVKILVYIVGQKHSIRQQPDLSLRHRQLERLVKDRHAYTRNIRRPDRKHRRRRDRRRGRDYRR